MTLAQYRDEILWLGWRALAAKTLTLRPAEAHALERLMRHPGRVVTFEALAAFDGDCVSVSRCLNGSRDGIMTRIGRLRAKLADVGCVGAILAAGGGGPRPADGYTISPAGAAQVEAALRYACGVAEEMAA